MTATSMQRRLRRREGGHDEGRPPNGGRPSASEQMEADQARPPVLFGPPSTSSIGLVSGSTVRSEPDPSTGPAVAPESVVRPGTSGSARLLPVPPSASLASPDASGSPDVRVSPEAEASPATPGSLVEDAGLPGGTAHGSSCGD